jgi:hypothetical protein
MSSELWAAFAGAVLGGGVSISSSVLTELWKARRAGRTATVLLFEATLLAGMAIDHAEPSDRARVAATGARSVVNAWARIAGPSLRVQGCKNWAI